MQVSAAPSPRTARPGATRFFLGIAVVMVVFMFVGFGRSLYLRPILGTVDRFGPHLPMHLIAHGAALTTWFVLFAIQALLVRTSRQESHRRLGVLGAAVAVAVVVTSVITMHMVVARVGGGGAAWPPRLVSVIVGNAWRLVVFTALVTAAVHFRRRPETHKRLLLLASVFLLAPALSIERPLGRTLVPLLPNGLVASTLFTLVSISGLIWYDIATKKRIHPATVWGSAAIVAALAATQVMLSGSSGSTFVRWLGGLGV